MAFVNIDLDLQTLICTLLRPSDILTLRKTCKTLQIVTSQRTVWIDALRRVCLENTLFLPSFSIPDMSDAELEQAAIAPRRWIELSTPPAARGPSGREVNIYRKSTTIRPLDNPFGSSRLRQVILVPGGRYLLCFARDRLGIYDLGNLPSGACKLIASVATGLYDDLTCLDTGHVHATPDGMGLVVVVHRDRSSGYGESFEFYEIYPQSENPQFTKISCFHIPPRLVFSRTFVFPGKVVSWNLPQSNEVERVINLRIWDYQLNASASFVALLDGEIWPKEIVATQTAIVIFNMEAIHIWAIPLVPQPLNFDDDDHLPQLPPVIKVTYPDSLSLPSIDFNYFQTLSSWYFVDPSTPLYFDKVYTNERPPQLQRFKLIIEPDFSDATLHFINTFRLHDRDGVSWVSSAEYQLCEDTLVAGWKIGYSRLYSGSILSRPISNGKLAYITKIFLPIVTRGKSFCPASGRVVYLPDEQYDPPPEGAIMVMDLLPQQRRL